MRKNKLRKIPALAQKAFKALQVAVANTIEEHRRTGLPLVVWQNGRVVKIPASRLKKMTSRYRKVA